MSNNNILEGWEHLSPDDWRLPLIRQCGEVLSNDQVVRLYNDKGEHTLSILRCYTDGGIDIADPDGKVLFCYCEKNEGVAALLELLIEELGKEELSQQ